MRTIPICPREVVADAIARVVAGPAWVGTVAELHAAIGAAALDGERQDRAWPASPAALARWLRAQSDALRARGLRLSVMPVDLLIERLRVSSAAEPKPPDRRFSSRRRAA